MSKPKEREWVSYNAYEKQRQNAIAKGPIAEADFYTRNKGRYLHTGLHNGDQPCPTGYHDPAEPDVQWFCFCDDKERLIERQTECKERLKAIKAELKLIDKLLERV